MREIMGIKYISEKEAANRYGFSISWFQKLRNKKNGPKFIKILGKGKVLYPLSDIDSWFQQKMQVEN